MVLSFPRKREPSQINKLDSRFRGNDDLFSASLTYSLDAGRLMGDPIYSSRHDPRYLCPETRRSTGALNFLIFSSACLSAVMSLMIARNPSPSSSDVINCRLTSTG